MPSLFRIANFEARENDSRLYTRFVGQLEERPVVEFIALEWRNFSPYQDPNSPYVRDHLVGQFIPSVALAKIGWDSQYVHYVINQLYRLFIPLLLYFFALSFLDSKKAFWVMVCGHINVMALNYGLRANQEQALLFGLLLSLYGFTEFQKKRGKLAFFLGSLFGFLVKGLVGLLHYPFWILWVLIFSQRKKEDIFKLVMVGIAILICSGLYEFWFWQVTGVSFWRGYFEIQVFGRNGPSSLPFSSLLYYIKRSVGYCLPWLFGIFWLIKRQKSLSEKQFLTFCTILSLGFLLIFGAFSRHASRYIFPVYYLLSAVGAVGYAHLNIFGRWASRMTALKCHLLLFWTIFFIQYGTYLYKGKTYIN
jgi:4-amino-4-deoxy-L-arabinose transferase-like glycosyltransferase